MTETISSVPLPPRRELLLRESIEIGIIVVRTTFPQSVQYPDGYTEEKLMQVSFDSDEVVWSDLHKDTQLSIYSSVARGAESGVLMLPNKPSVTWSLKECVRL